MTRETLGIGSRISHPTHGKGVLTDINAMTYSIVFIDEGEVEISKDSDELSIIERVDPDQGRVSMWDVEQTLTKLLRKWSDVNENAKISDKWKKGKMILQPFDRSMQSKEIDIDTFFHKIVMVRDRIRVMEQRINAHKVLDDEDKVNLQQYITRIYGSLTTFNVLFRDKEDGFEGEKS